MRRAFPNCDTNLNENLSQTKARESRRLNKRESGLTTSQVTTRRVEATIILTGQVQPVLAVFY